MVPAVCEDGVDDAADVSLELGADVEGRVDPAVVVHHLRAHPGRSLQLKGERERLGKSSMGVELQELSQAIRASGKKLNSRARLKGGPQVWW